MIDNTSLEKLLDRNLRQEGFSLKSDNDSICLFFSGQVLIKFAINDYTLNEIGYQINSYISLGKGITDSLMTISDGIRNGSFNAVKDEMCYHCGKKCKDLCKLAQSILQSLYLQAWKNYVQTN